MMRMGAIAVLLTGCYEPSLKDCTVSCAAATDCASGQVCAANGFCAAEGASCAPPTDAAVPTVTLHVVVMGHGSVQVAGGGTCTSDCMYKFSPGAAITATAVEDNNHNFDMWTTPNCMGKSQVCMFTLTAAQNLGAKFQ